MGPVIRNVIRDCIRPVMGDEALMRDSLDPLVSAFQSASGATDVTELDALVKYVRAESLLSNFRIYPMKSAQNAGSGATVYGVGSLTTNNMTLVNSPTWGATGITFNGTTQYGTIPDFIGSQHMYLYLRTTATAVTGGGSATHCLASQYAGVQRGFVLRQRDALADDPLSVFLTKDGTFSNFKEDGVDPAPGLGADNCFVVNVNSDGSIALWLNKASQTLTTRASAGTVDSVFDSSAVLSIGARSDGASPAPLAGHAAAYVYGAALTTTQRETITDLINAL